MTITFKKNKNQLIHRNGTKFNNLIQQAILFNICGEQIEESCLGCYDIYTWHWILSHCNYGGIKKVPNVVERMIIKEKIGTPNKDCETCIQGIFSQSRKR